MTGETVKRVENQTEEELVKKAAAGDEVAQDFIFLKYREMVKSKANLYFLMGGDKDDLMQEGMIGLFWAITHYDADKAASFHTYAEVCVGNQMINAVKAASRKKHGPLNDFVPIRGDGEGESESPDLEDQLADTATETPEEYLLLRDQVEYLEKNLDKIFSRLERTVLADFVSGRTYLEIAARLGKSPKAIDNAIQRIRRKIEKHLDVHG